MEAGFGRKQGRQRKAKGSAPGPRWGLDAPDPHQFWELLGGEDNATASHTGPSDALPRSFRRLSV